MRTYDELTQITTFNGRFDYLRLRGKIGDDTFGFDRYLNQLFYTSKEWREFRDGIILRDNGCDLGIPGEEIVGRIIIHHMNPITIQDIRMRNPDIVDPRYVICCGEDTHKAIHYSKGYSGLHTFENRQPNDTCPWRNG